MIGRLWRPWRFTILGLLAITLVAVTVWRTLEKREREKREVTYQRTLLSYSKVLTPGMSRKDVEDYFHSRNIVFQQMCCVDPNTFSKGVYDDLVRIGHEDAPWFCSEHNVYVAFEFAGQRASDGNPQDAQPRDRLTAVTISHRLERCM